MSSHLDVGFWGITQAQRRTLQGAAGFNQMSHAEALEPRLFRQAVDMYTYGLIADLSHSRVCYRMNDIDPFSSQQLCGWSLSTDKHIMIQHVNLTLVATWPAITPTMRPPELFYKSTCPGMHSFQ